MKKNPFQQFVDFLFGKEVKPPIANANPAKVQPYEDPTTQAEVKTEATTNRTRLDFSFLDEGPVSIDSIIDLIFDDEVDHHKLARQIKSLDWAEADIDQLTIVFDYLLRFQEGETIENFINKLDITLFATEADHFNILRMISDDQNQTTPSNSILALKTLIGKKFNAGAYIAEADADVFKIFAQQSRNPDNNHFNKELLKILIQTGKVVGYESPDPNTPEILSDLAKEIIAGIDDGRIILHSIAEISKRATPQYHERLAAADEDQDLSTVVPDSIRTKPVNTQPSKKVHPLPQQSLAQSSSRGNETTLN